MGVEDCRTWRRFMKLRRTAGNSYLKICWQSNALRRTCSNRHKDCGQFPDIAEVLERIYRDGMKPREALRDMPTKSDRQLLGGWKA